MKNHTPVFNFHTLVTTDFYERIVAAFRLVLLMNKKPRSVNEKLHFISKRFFFKQNSRLLALAVFGCFTFFTSAQAFQWGACAGATALDGGLAITTDAAGNVYSTGQFIGIVDFDPGPGTATLNAPLGSPDCYIQKLSPSGSLIWVKKIGGNGADVGRAIELDNLGNVIVGGSYQLTADFDPGPAAFTYTSNGFADAFVVKLDNSGNFIWAKALGSTNGDLICSVATATNNDVVVAGSFDGTVDFDPGAATYTLTTPGGGIDAFVLKLDVNGNFIWAGGFGLPVETDQVNSIDLDASGNVYATGFFKGTVDFDIGAGTFTMTASGSNTDCFITKYNSTGSFVWAKQIGGTQADRGASLKVASGGDVYIGGVFKNTVDMDPGSGTFTFTSVAGFEDAFLLKLDASGNFSWAKVFGSGGDDNIASVDVDPYSNVYAVGNYSGTVDFDPGVGTYTLASLGLKDNFFVKLDDNGNFNFAASFGTSAADISSAVGVDNLSNVYTTGAYTGTIDLDPGSGVSNCISQGSNDIFIQKLAGCTSPSMAVSNTPTNNLIICEGQTTTLSATSSGSVNWYNVSTGGTSLQTGSSFITPTLSAGNYTFYAEAVTCTVSSLRAAIIVSVAPCTGIKEYSEKALNAKVYPNPASDNVVVEADKETKLCIVNALGQVVSEKTLLEEINNINISELHRGVYYFKVTKNAHYKMFKIIKK